MRQFVGFSILFVLVGCVATSPTPQLGTRPTSSSQRLPNLYSRSSFSREVDKQCDVQGSLVTCSTALIPAARGVKTTRDERLVAACTSLGIVRADVPYATPGDGRNEMKNKTAASGGNVLLVTSDTRAEGVQYSCDASVVAGIR
jgi:hypothetical protein